MATIYDKHGNTVATNLFGCDTNTEAYDVATVIAKARCEPVHLEDDDGDWVVYADGPATRWPGPHWYCADLDLGVWHSIKRPV